MVLSKYVMIAGSLTFALIALSRSCPFWRSIERAELFWRHDDVLTVG